MFGEGKEYEPNILYELKITNVENFPEYQSSVQGHDWIKIIFSFDKLASKTYFIKYFTPFIVQLFLVI